VFHFLVGAIIAVVAVFLFGLIIPASFSLMNPRPFPDWDTGITPLLGGCVGLAAALVAWLCVRRDCDELAVQLRRKTLLATLVVIAAGTLLYGYFGPRATVSSLQREIEIAIAPGASRQEVIAWIREHRLRIDPAPVRCRTIAPWSAVDRRRHG
jgi:hypothetical protein